RDPPGAARPRRIRVPRLGQFCPLHGEAGPDMTWEAVREIITMGLVLVSSLMCFAAGVGLIRFPDVLSRLHAATKPQILGLMSIGAAIAVNNPRIGIF